MCFYPMDDLIVCVLRVDLLPAEGALLSVVNWRSESSRMKDLEENNGHW